MSGWSMLRMTILAARRVLPPDLMTPAKASKPFMKLSGPLAVPPPLRAFGGGTQRGEIGAGAGSPLEEHAFGLGQGQDGVERIFHRVDEAGGALRACVSGDAEFDLLGGCGFQCQLRGVGVGLDAVAAYVEPDGRVEGGVLADEDVDEFVVEGGAVFGGAEVAFFHAPVADGFGDAGYQLADSGLALGRCRSVPCRYFEATMLVAVMDQSLGTSTSFCSKIMLPWESVI